MEGKGTANTSVPNLGQPRDLGLAAALAGT